MSGVEEGDVRMVQIKTWRRVRVCLTAAEWRSNHRPRLRMDAT